MNLTILKSINNLEFASNLRVLTMERIVALYAIWNSSSGDGSNSSRSRKRWISECLRDNIILYKASMLVLKTNGVLVETKSDKSTMVLLGELGKEC